MKAEQAARNARIFEKIIRGSTLASAGEGLSAERTRQIVYKMRRMMLKPERLGNDTVPDRHYGILKNMGGAGLKEMRADADFWLAQLSKWREKLCSDAGCTPNNDCMRGRGWRLTD